MARREVETASYLDFARRIIRRAGTRVGQADDWELAELISIREDVEEAIATAVAGLRSRGPAWEYLGPARGVSRQAAPPRYGERVAS